MHINCISASNISHTRENSTSRRICCLVSDIIAETRPDATVEITCLVD